MPVVAKWTSRSRGRSEAQIPLSGPREIHVNDSEAYFTGEVPLVNYLVATGKPVGLILNS
jgi:hypothetical protein